MNRNNVFAVLSCAAISLTLALAGCSGGGGGGNTVSPAPDVSMNVTTLTGVATVPGAVDGAGVGGGSEFMTPMKGAVISGTLYVTDPDVHVIKAINLANNNVTTFSGTAGIPGPVTETTTILAQFNRPTGIASQGTTTLFVADSGNNAIRMIALGAGLVTTLTTSTGFGGLASLAISPDGLSLYAADELNGAVYRISLATGAVVESITGPFADGITMFVSPYSLSTGTNAVYVADTGQDVSSAVIKIDVASSLVSVVAGSVGQSGYLDDVGGNARFNSVYGVHFEQPNTLYVVEAINRTLRAVDLDTLVVSTVAGKAGHIASIDGLAPGARFSCPDGVTGDGTFEYVFDQGDNTVKKVDVATHRVTTIAGTVHVRGPRNGVGPRAVLWRPEGIVSEGTGTYLFFTDRELHTVRRVSAATGDVVTITGLANDAGWNDGLLSTATFSAPSGIAYDIADQVLYVADAGNNALRAIDFGANAVTTIASGLSGPTGITLAGNTLYFADTNNNHVKSVPSGTAGGTISVVASSLSFSSPTGIATDGTRIFVADTGNHRIVSINSGTAVVLAGSGAFGFADGTGTAAQFDGPTGLALDPTNTYLYVVDSGNGAVRRIAVATGAVQTVAGGISCAGSADGKGSAAQFCSPLGVAVHAGKVYVTDAGNNIIRTLQ